MKLMVVIENTRNLKLLFLNKYIFLYGLKLDMQQAATGGVPRERLLQKMDFPKSGQVNM